MLPPLHPAPEATPAAGTPASEFRFLVSRARIPLLVLGLLLFIHLVQDLFVLDFGRLGVFPRSLKGLHGIFTYPLVHGDWQHLFNNSLPLLVLGTSLFYFFPRSAFRISGGIVLFSGLWIWLTGSPAWHIGASGLVYGLAFFLFFVGVFSRHRQLMSIALVVVVLYGGMVWGLFPIQEHVSWEGHLGGAIIGTALGYHYRHLAAPAPTTPPLPPPDFQHQSHTATQPYTFIYRPSTPNSSAQTPSSNNDTP